jgi:hypothetical protein
MIKKYENIQFIGSEINPDDFTVCGLLYLEECGDGYEKDFELQIDFIRDEELFDYNSKGKYSVAFDELKGRVLGGKCNCNHCNRHISYVVFAIDNVNETLHSFGSDCGRGLSLKTDQIESFVKNAKDKNMMARKKSANLYIRNQFLIQHEGLEDALKTDHDIVRSIRENFVKYHSLSDAQVKLVFKLQETTRKFEELKQIRIQNIEHIVDGRKKGLDAEILKIDRWIKNDNFTSNELRAKLLLQFDNGQKVWGSMPVGEKFFEDFTKDMRVSFTGTVTKSPTDPTFGFFKRGSLSLQS